MITKSLEAFIPRFEEALKQALSHSKTEYDQHYKAMEYSLLAGGKRLRPFIMGCFYRASGGEGDAYLPFAIALEMIHTYSLIHDDLPCMDDDDLRRGRPSCHKAFGEDTALLAGDGLLTLAFETAAKTKEIAPNLVLEGVARLAGYAGADGMIGGQMIDLSIENQKTDLATVSQMYQKKTGALLAAAANIGVLLANGSALQQMAAERYAHCLGMAFQIQDDLLDQVGDRALLGKPIGSDAKSHKSTYLSLVGEKQARADILAFTNDAKAALSAFAKTDQLQELTDALIDRAY